MCTDLESDRDPSGTDPSQKDSEDDALKQVKREGPLTDTEAKNLSRKESWLAERGSGALDPKQHLEESTN